MKTLLILKKKKVEFEIIPNFALKRIVNKMQCRHFFTGKNNPFTEADLVLFLQK